MDTNCKWTLSPALQAFFGQLINGLTVGSFYALIALGYTMVYGVLSMVNFAHGDIFMVGAYCGLFTIGRLQIHRHCWKQTRCWRS